MTRQEIAELAAGFAIVLPQPLTIYWILFALAMYPWIVPADHSRSIVDAGENAATAGVGLAVISFLTPLWAAGLFGRGRFAAGIGAVLFAVLALASFWLYPSDDSIKFFPVRSFAHAISAIAVALGAAGLRLSRSADLRRRSDCRTV